MSTLDPITPEDVHAAIVELRDPGDSDHWPSVNDVRDHLGRGSWTTIQKHLRAYRQAQREAATAPPPEVLEAGKRLAQELWRLAGAQARDQDHESVQRLTAQIEGLTTARDEALTLVTAANTEVDSLEAAAIAYVTAIEELKSQAIQFQGILAERDHELHDQQVKLTFAHQEEQRLRADYQRLDQSATILAQENQAQRDRDSRQIEDLRSARDTAILRGDRCETENVAARNQVQRLSEDLIEIRTALQSLTADHRVELERTKHLTELLTESEARRRETVEKLAEEVILRKPVIAKEEDPIRDGGQVM